MVYLCRTESEVRNIGYRYPEEVYKELLTGCAALDRYYGSDRTGGYFIVAETEEDLVEMNATFDSGKHICEWVTRLGTSGFLSALYVLDNDFCVTVIMPEAIAPKKILHELE